MAQKKGCSNLNPSLLDEPILGKRKPLCWAWHEFANEGPEEAILFSIQDIPVMKSLSLYRDEPYEENSGHQPVTSHFDG